MELMVLFVCLLTFLLCGAIILVVSWMGSKERSYEEAVEETKKKCVSPSAGGSAVNGSKKKKESKAKTVRAGKKGTRKEDLSEEETPKKKEEEEEEMMIEVETPSLSASAPPKEEHIPQPKAQKKSKKTQSASPKEEKRGWGEPWSVSEILCMVKKTSMDEGECQHMIDVLLNKQVGQTSTAGAWVQNSNSSSSFSASSSSSSSATSVKSLQKQLQEKESELTEWNSRVKSISDKLVQLRQELNSATIVANNSTRLMDEMRSKHEKEMSALQLSHQQSLDNRVKECTLIQSRLTTQLAKTQELENQLSQIAPTQQPTTLDASLNQEVEELKLAKSELESRITQLTSQVNQFKETENKLEEKLSTNQKISEEVSNSQNDKINELKSYIVSLEASSQASDESSNVIAKLTKTVQELSNSKKDMELKTSETQLSLDSLIISIKDKESEVARLIEENDRLSEQLASAVERPKAEGQEDNCDVNSVQEEINSGRSWENMYESVLNEKENMVKAHESVISAMKTEIDSIKTQANGFAEELEAQRNKNNELREKNWKAMEAVKTAEEKLLAKSKHDIQATNAVSQAQEKLIDEQKQFLSRLLPTAEIPTSDYGTWMSFFEKEFNKTLDNYRLTVNESASTISKLEKQVSDYKSIITDTENMLHQLESSVESEEKNWEHRMRIKEIELDEVKQDKNRLSEKNSALDESINVVKQAEEVTQDYALFILDQKRISNYMQVKLHELQEKLGSEEKEKKELLLRISQLNSLESENSKLNEELSILKSINSDMGERVAKMDLIVNSGQEALQHEQRTVLVMRDQIHNLNKNSTEPHAENGQSLNGKSVNGGSNNNDTAQINGDTYEESIDSLNSLQNIKKKKKKRKAKKDTPKD
ncbi:uncharacterized protein [Lepeophtheirus salmonis]|uniref:uncharacterized protein isoform X2 n=1 Tax=Lepeophtheirus salmonis TaxID=72036 RepID=UPI001AEA4E9A|nr:ribosome-binding protein 1-like isoform X3 [Lepeophtheirus salmonis]